MTAGRPTIELAPDTLEFESVIHSLDYAAETAPDRIALICGDEKIDFEGYRRAVGGIAVILSNICEPGDRAAVMMTNSIEMAVVLMGCMAAGIQTAPLNPALTERELLPLFYDIDAKVLICDYHSEKKVTDLATILSIKEIYCANRDFDIWGFSKDKTLSLPNVLPLGSDRASMFFTGGTTGLPKGAEHTHHSIAVYAPLTHALWKFRFDEETFLNVAPMFHIWGHHFSLVFPLYLRCTMVIVPQYSPKLVLQELEINRVTVFAGGPAAIFLGLLETPNIDATDFSFLKYSIAGGSPCPEGLLRRWKKKTNNIILEGWGMSEGAPINANPTHGLKKPLSVGLTNPRTEIDIVDLDTGLTVLPVGEKGEIRLRGPQFSFGYRNRPEDTAETMRGGWLYTGDIGYFDDQGYLYLVDRKKEMIIVGGYNVYPREVDEVLTNHPSVAEAATVGVPNEFSGEVPHSFVALVVGEKVREDELISFCSDKLVKYKIPKGITIIDSLPKKGPGKIDKMALKESAQHK
ncbi:MAG: AMP-binding protein [Pseudomonadota bacterium]|nr:AMP-binding protein [Pseudomonadota bacterium]